MPKSFLVATFSDPDTLLHAVRAVVRENFKVYDVYAPYPIHGLDAAMGIRRSRLRSYICPVFPALHLRA
jgi:hypothetical protein